MPWSIVTSWRRCRDVYRIDPEHAGPAPAGAGRCAASALDAAMFAELGGIGSTLTDRYPGTLTAVTDAAGRILATWGRGRVRDRAEEVGRAPSFVWDEPTAGTNAVGTAIVRGGTCAVEGAQHWSARLHDWSSVAVAVAAPSVDGAVLSVSCWREPVPLRRVDLVIATRPVAALLGRTVRHREDELLAAFDRVGRGTTTALVALDPSGRVVAANSPARLHLDAAPGRHGLIADTPSGGTPAAFVGRACDQARRDPAWRATVTLRPVRGGEPDVYELIPVLVGDDPVGVLARASRSAPDTRGEEPAPTTPTHVAAVTGRGRIVRVPVSDIRFAHSAGHVVWLTTGHGRLRAARRGIDRVEEELRGAGFLRVHRSYLVNLDHVREITPHGDHLTLRAGSCADRIPVSRRSAPTVRRALGLRPR